MGRRAYKRYGKQDCDHCHREFDADYDAPPYGGNPWLCPHCGFNNVGELPLADAIARADTARKLELRKRLKDHEK